MSDPSGEGDFHDIALSDASNNSIQQSPPEEQTPTIEPAETSEPSNTTSPQILGATTPTRYVLNRYADNPGSPADSQGNNLSGPNALSNLGFRRSTISTPSNNRSNLRTQRNDWHPGQPGNSPWGPPPRRNPGDSNLTLPSSAGASGTLETSGLATTTGSSWTTRPSTSGGELSTDEATFSAEPASTTEPTASSPPKIPTYIHPISKGGSVTWDNHNDFVYTRGKDRGPRVPAPMLPEGYKSQGPLKSFNFDKLRQSRGKSAPVSRFRDEYEGKQRDQTPTSLVTEIVSYYVSNEDDHIAALLGKATENQAMSFTIRAQELEIKQLKEDGAEAVAVKEQRKNMEELNETIKERETTISNLRRQIRETEGGTHSRKDIENEEHDLYLMNRIIELEAELQTRNEESSASVQNPDSARYKERIRDLLIDVENKQDTIDNLIVTIKEIEEEPRMRGQSSRSSQDSVIANQNKMMHDISATIDELSEAVRQRKEEILDPSQDPERVEGGEMIQDQDETISDLRNRLRRCEANAAVYAAERSRLEAQLKKLSKLHKEHKATINHLVHRNYELEEASRTQHEASFEAAQDAERAIPETLSQLLQERGYSISDLLRRYAELEEAESARQEVRATTLPNKASIEEMIQTAKEITAVNLESQARVILMIATNCLETKQYPAAGQEVGRAEDIIRRQLPHLTVLHGKCMYLSGRGWYEQGFLVEAINDLKRAGQLGYDKNCGEVDGDRTLPLLTKAKAAHDRAEQLGYPAGAYLGDDLAGGSGAER